MKVTPTPIRAALILRGNRDGLRVAGCGLRVAGYVVRGACCEVRVTGYGVRGTCCYGVRGMRFGVRVAGYGVRVARCEVRVARFALRGAGCGSFDFGFGIWEFGLNRSIGCILINKDSIIFN